MKVGILAVQGAFIEHRKMLEELGVPCIEIRQPADLISIDGLVLPGGESTVQGKLLWELNLFCPLQTMINNGLPTLATCAGLILLASKLCNDKSSYFKTLPISVRRNAYGRQLGSFREVASFDGLTNVPMTFIRAPYVEDILDNEVQVLATVNQKIVAVQYKNQIGLSFHPELDEDTRIHQRFLGLINT